MAVELEEPSLPLDERGALTADFACEQCTYNLRGLREDSRCPECGTPVERSTRGYLLRFADPDWLDKVARGLRITLWVFCLWMLLSIVSGLLGDAIPVIAGEITTLLLALAGYYGAWLLTTPEPNVIAGDRDAAIRKIVRVTLLVEILGGLFLFPPVPVTGRLGVLLAITGSVAGIVGCAGEFARFIYYEKLAKRVPHQSIVTWSRILRWPYAVGLAIVMAGAGVILGAGQLNTWRIGLTRLIYVLNAGGLTFFVSIILTTFLLFRLRRVIAEQASTARVVWDTAGRHARQEPENS